MYGYGSMWPMGTMMVDRLLLTVLVVGVVVWLLVAYAKPQRDHDDTGVARRILASGVMINMGYQA